MPTLAECKILILIRMTEVRHWFRGTDTKQQICISTVGHRGLSNNDLAAQADMQLQAVTHAVRMSLCVPERIQMKLQCSQQEAACP